MEVVEREREKWLHEPVTSECVPLQIQLGGVMTRGKVTVAVRAQQGTCGYRPYIRGQRIRVTDVLELVASAASFDEVLKDYAFLEREREDILAAIDYAAHQTDHVVIQVFFAR